MKVNIGVVLRLLDLDDRCSRVFSDDKTESLQLGRDSI